MYVSEYMQMYLTTYNRQRRHMCILLYVHMYICMWIFRMYSCHVNTSCGCYQSAFTSSTAINKQRCFVAPPGDVSGLGPLTLPRPPVCLLLLHMDYLLSLLLLLLLLRLFVIADADKNSVFCLPWWQCGLHEHTQLLAYTNRHTSILVHIPYTSWRWDGFDGPCARFCWCCCY